MFYEGLLVNDDGPSLKDGLNVNRVQSRYSEYFRSEFRRSDALDKLTPLLRSLLHIFDKERS